MCVILKRLGKAVISGPSANVVSVTAAVSRHTVSFSECSLCSLSFCFIKKQPIMNESTRTCAFTIDVAAVQLLVIGRLIIVHKVANQTQQRRRLRHLSGERQISNCPGTQVSSTRFRCGCEPSPEPPLLTRDDNREHCVRVQTSNTHIAEESRE